MKRKNLIAVKKAKKNKLLFKDSKILNFYIKFKSIINKDIKKKNFAIAVSGGSDSLCLSYFSKIYSHEFKNNEIFKASDTMVDSLTQLIARKRAKNSN